LKRQDELQKQEDEARRAQAEAMKAEVERARAVTRPVCALGLSKRPFRPPALVNTPACALWA